jgi:hypothetical protein
VSTVLHWSDSRKRSRFSAAGGVAVTAMPCRAFASSWKNFVPRPSPSCRLPRIPGKRSGDTPRDDGTRPAFLRRLREVEAAQRRIADGSYGVCLGCGRPIPIARLQAAPDTSCCHDCRMGLMKVRRRSETRTLPALPEPSGRVRPRPRPLERGVNRRDK